MRSHPSPVRTALVLLGLAACGDKPAPVETPVDTGATAPPVAAAYRTEPPAGKLPWPQHAPEFDQAEYDRMMSGLYIANNFALYQAGPTRESMYAHTGLDVVLPNGTRIHAVESGHVRFIERGSPYYNYVVVEDADEPGRAWGYVHVDGFRVKVGDFVPRGAWIASVSFRGLEHLHLSRFQRPEDGSWDRLVTLTYTQPDTFFHYPDTQRPLFAEEGFHYFRDRSDSLFSRGSPTVVGGDVDVVVGMRDPGEHGHGTAFPDDRQAVSRIEYEIQGPSGAPLRRLSFDFSRLVLGPRTTSTASYDQVATLFKYYPLIPGVRPYAQTRMSYYVVTNSPPEGRTGRLDLADGELSWRTAEKDAGEKPLFPDGRYVVTVRAFDFRGNSAEAKDTVLVRN